MHLMIMLLEKQAFAKMPHKKILTRAHGAGLLPCKPRQFRTATHLVVKILLTESFFSLSRDTSISSMYFVFGFSCLSCL